MARGHFRHHEKDQAGNAVEAASVAVRNAGGALLTLYAGPTGGTTKANPLVTDAGGLAECWIATPQTVTLVVTDNGLQAKVGGMILEAFSRTLTTEVQYAPEDITPGGGGGGGGGGAPTGAPYLVTAADPGLSAAVVVGATPGGELGGTWDTPTVDSTHAGSPHHGQSHGHTGGDGSGTVGHANTTGQGADDHHAKSHGHSGADGSGTVAHGALTTIGANDHHPRLHDHSGAGEGATLAPAVLLVPNTTIPAETAEGSMVWDSDDDALTVGTGAGRRTLSDTTHTHSRTQSRGGTVMSPAAGATAVIVWRAPFACTVIGVYGYRSGGTGATINARKNGASNHLAADLSVSAADTWMSGGAVQNTAFAIGDKLEILVQSTVGGPSQVAVQVDFSVPVL